MKSRVCITVKNSPNPLCVHCISGYANKGKKFSIAFIKFLITSSKNYNAGKDKKNHFTDQNVSSFNIDLTMKFSTDQSRLLVACLQLVSLYVTQPCLHTLRKTHLLAIRACVLFLVIL